MATRLTKIAADFQTTLAAALAVGATTGSLVSVTDDDGNALPNGNYFFTIDGDSATNKEHIVCTITGTALSAIKTVTRQGVQTSGIARVHRLGAQVILTDWAVLNEITNLLNGTTALDGANPLIYDTDPAITDAKHLATKKYVDDTTTAGAPIATTILLGISKLSVAAVDVNAPIAVGDNDPRIPTTDQKAALAGTGTPSSSNKFVTADDANLTNNVKTTGNQTVAGIKTFSSIPVLPASDPTTANQATRKAYVDGLMAYTTGSFTDGTVGGQTFTLYYQKIGKIYFGFYAQCTGIQGNGYLIPIYPDATTANRICTKLSKTLSARYDNSFYFSAQGSYIRAIYNGSSWASDTGNNIGNNSTIAAIVVT